MQIPDTNIYIYIYIYILIHWSNFKDIFNIWIVVVGFCWYIWFSRSKWVLDIYFLCLLFTFCAILLLMERWSSNIIQVLFLNLSQRLVWKNDGWTAFEILFSNVFLLFSLCNISSYLQITLSSSCVLSTLFWKTFRFSSALRCSVYFDQQQGSMDFSSSPQYVNSSANNWPQISDGACNFPIIMNKSF